MNELCGDARSLGFSFTQEGESSAQGAEALGQNTHALLTEMGLETDAVAALGRTSVVRHTRLPASDVPATQPLSNQ